MTEAWFGTEDLPEHASKYTQKCGLCHNSGMVSVRPKPGTVFKTSHGHTLPPDAIISVYCPCQDGQELAELRANPKTNKERPRRLMELDREIMEIVLI